MKNRFLFLLSSAISIMMMFYWQIDNVYTASWMSIKLLGFTVLFMLVMDAVLYFIKRINRQFCLMYILFVLGFSVLNLSISILNFKGVF